MAEQKDLELSPSQERHLVTLKEEINKLITNFNVLLRTATIGRTEEVVTDNLEDNDIQRLQERGFIAADGSLVDAIKGPSSTSNKTTVERSVDVSSLPYADLQAAALTHQYQQQTATNQLVFSCESLLSLISELRTTQLLYDIEDQSTILQQLATPIIMADRTNQRTILQLNHDVMDAIKDIEKWYYASPAMQRVEGQQGTQ